VECGFEQANHGSVDLSLSPGRTFGLAGIGADEASMGGVVVEVVVQRCAGIDVSKRDGKVCVRLQGRGSRRTSSVVTTWSSSMPSILRLRDKLVQDGVELVVMESTSDYWRPFFYLLSEHLTVILVKASDVRAMPGRKSDVPPEDIRQLRDLTRSRTILLASGPGRCNGWRRSWQTPASSCLRW
jgi:hypothetical protein